MGPYEKHQEGHQEGPCERQPAASRSLRVSAGR
ncbi:hypothetical protein BN159_p7 (plasmid) [Streptomyces davaonensis JCM 4913]|uniref:Uncharacterized protein n=1 Tax=Streptomyces davaonensis (strain DSM 101723 / JCM 4913 / KCC S-0913 / 768) TaxID=1214101 RepID=K4RG53_STRDJ|nr:hypothetical protein BN159_p7 [Streptomyces davaonensis JCM 4913]